PPEPAFGRPTATNCRRQGARMLAKNYPRGRANGSVGQQVIGRIDGFVPQAQRGWPHDRCCYPRSPDCPTGVPRDPILRWQSEVTLLDTITSAARSLQQHKLRSSLTALGIIIGTSATIAMLAIGAGAREEVAAQIRSMGSNLMIIVSGNVNHAGVRL